MFLSSIRFGIPFACVHRTTIVLCYGCVHQYRPERCLFWEKNVKLCGRHIYICFVVSVLWIITQIYMNKIRNKNSFWNSQRISWKHENLIKNTNIFYFKTFLIGDIQNNFRKCFLRHKYYFGYVNMSLKQEYFKIWNIL